MRVIFIGSSEIAIPPLEKILNSSNHNVVGIISQPDKPAGRKQKLSSTALKSFALSKGLSVFTPESISSTNTGVLTVETIFGPNSVGITLAPIEGNFSLKLAQEAKTPEGKVKATRLDEIVRNSLVIKTKLINNVIAILENYHKKP